MFGSEHEEKCIARYYCRELKELEAAVNVEWETENGKEKAKRKHL